jgi:hypothetical protein
LSRTGVPPEFWTKQKQNDKGRTKIEWENPPNNGWFMGISTMDDDNLPYIKGSRTFKFPINQPLSTGAELKSFDRKSLILNPVSCLWLQQLNGLGARLMGHFL